MYFLYGKKHILQQSIREVKKGYTIKTESILIIFCEEGKLCYRKSRHF